MSKFTIVTESTCDLSAERIKDYGVVMVQGSFTLADGTTHTNETISYHEFFKYLREGGSAKTAAINSVLYADAFRAELEKGNDILYLGFSSGLSATYNCAVMAAEELRAEFPERTILTVDTLCASLGQGLMVHLCVEKQKSGASLEETYNYALETKDSLVHRFTVNDLYFLKRGGRVSATTAVVGSLLSIKPLMYMDYEGHLTVAGKARGRKVSIEAIVERFGETAKDINPDMPVFICHGDCIEDAEYMASLVKDKYGIKDVYIDYVGPFIAAHSGPGTLALFFVGKER